VDVPPEKASSPRRLSRPFAKSLPNEESVENTATFCSTCLKNQHLLTETLANYLPAAGDSSYKQYEASYPEFRKQLEERYPPVCAQCEPEVRRRIQQAGYTAKSDHLKRMMERSRARKIARRWGWRSLVVTLGGLLFWSSAIGQLAWNLISIWEDSKKISLNTADNNTSPLIQCTAQLLKDFETNSGCAAAFSSIGFVAIVVGFLCSWWNPKWQHKLQGREGRLVGLQEYYQVNTAVLLARSGFWLWAHNSTILTSTESGHKLIHSTVLFMTLLFTIYTLTRVKIDMTPLVSWQESPVQLLSQHQYNPPVAPGSMQQPYSSRLPSAELSNPQSFPVSSLAPQPQRQIWQAPTPPSDEDGDVMEWEPSQSFQPNPRRAKIKAVPGPSPFHGVLPAMPTNRLLHPQTQRQTAPKESIGLPPGFFDKRNQLRSSSQSAALPPLAQPRFFSQGDRDADTGLESIFDAVFSLRDVPVISNAVAEQKEPATLEQEGRRISVPGFTIPHTPWYGSIKLSTTHAAKIAMFAACLLMLHTSRRLQLDMNLMKLTVLCIACLVLLISALPRNNTTTSVPDSSDIAWSAVMAFFAGVLILQEWNHIGPEARKSNDGAAIIFFFLCSFWEIPRLFELRPMRSTNSVTFPDTQANLWCGSRTQDAEASGSEVKPQSLKFSQEPRQSWLSDAQSPALQEPRWNLERFPSPKPAPTLRANEDRPFYRTRSDSTDSMISQSSSTTIDTVTTAGWGTPNFRVQNVIGAGQSPAFNLRSLALDDGAPTPRRREQGGVQRRNRGTLSRE
jgi:Ima1 N-terminal domain